MGNNFNPMQLIQMIKSGQNPQQLALNMLEERAGQNPFSANLLNLVKDNKTAEVEMIARNMCQEKGVDFDKAFNDFKNTLGL